MRTRPRLTAADVVATATATLLYAPGGSTNAASRRPSNGVGAAQLKNGAVTTKKIKNGAVTAAKINP